MPPTPAAGFYARLRERHLLPVLTGWFGLCWALVEVSGFLAERYGAPERLIDAVFVAMWAFLPLVALLTWWIGAPGPARWTRRRLGLAVLLFALGGVVVLKADLRGPAAPPLAAAPAVPAPEPAEPPPTTPWVMVFPFSAGAALPEADRWLAGALPALAEHDLAYDPRLRAASAVGTLGQQLQSQLRLRGARDIDSSPLAARLQAARALGFQAVVVALLFLPVEVELGEQRLGVAPFRRQRLPRGAGALLVQPPDQVGGLGVVQTGDAIEDLGGIVDPLGGDPVDRQSQLAQGVAQAVAIGAAGLHHHLDADRRHQPAQPRHQQGGLLRMAPADDLNGFIPRHHPVRHEVGFGDIHREGDRAAARRLSQGCPIDLVDSRGLVSTLVHGDSSTLWVR